MGKNNYILCVYIFNGWCHMYKKIKLTSLSKKKKRISLSTADQWFSHIQHTAALLPPGRSLCLRWSDSNVQSRNRPLNIHHWPSADACHWWHSATSCHQWRDSQSWRNANNRLCDYNHSTRVDSYLPKSRILKPSPWLTTYLVDHLQSTYSVDKVLCFLVI